MPGFLHFPHPNTMSLERVRFGPVLPGVFAIVAAIPADAGGTEDGYAR